MIIAYDSLAVGALDPFELKFAGTVKLATIVDGVSNRAKFQKVVFALTWADEQ